MKNEADRLQRELQRKLFPRGMSYILIEAEEAWVSAKQRIKGPDGFQKIWDDFFLTFAEEIEKEDQK